MLINKTLTMCLHSLRYWHNFSFTASVSTWNYFQHFRKNNPLSCNNERFSDPKQFKATLVWQHESMRSESENVFPQDFYRNMSKLNNDSTELMKKWPTLVDRSVSDNFFSNFRPILGRWFCDNSASASDILSNIEITWLPSFRHWLKRIDWSWLLKWK